MPFSLSRYPGTVVFVDDDENYLSAIRATFPPTPHIKTFADPNEFVAYMATQIAVAKDMEAYFQGSIDRSKKSGSVAIEVLRFWNAFPDRFAMPQVVVIDYHMPNLNGLDALEKCKEWKGSRILMTGVADEALVCKAFNYKRIDYYIAKQNTNIMRQIVVTTTALLKEQNLTSWAQWNPWYISMSPEQKLFLREPQVAAELSTLLGGEFEHVVIGSPFGVMALGHAGGVKWIQLETTSSLDEAADLAAKNGSSNEDVQSVRAGRALTDARINAALAIAGQPLAVPCSFQVRIPRINEMLYGALFDVSAAGAPPAEFCYTAWNARQQPGS